MIWGCIRAFTGWIGWFPAFRFFYDDKVACDDDDVGYHDRPDHAGGNGHDDDGGHGESSRPHDH